MNQLYIDKLNAFETKWMADRDRALREASSLDDITYNQCIGKISALRIIRSFLDKKR